MESIGNSNYNYAEVLVNEDLLAFKTTYPHDDVFNTIKDKLKGTDAVVVVLDDKQYKITVAEKHLQTVLQKLFCNSL